MLDPYNVLKLLGIEAGWSYPIVTDCPLCGRRSKLEIRTGNHVICHACHFIGDVIQLLAAFRKEPLSEVVDELTGLSLVNFAEQQATGKQEAYLVKMARQKQLQDFLRERVDDFQNNLCGSLRGVLDHYGVHAPDKVIRSLAPHICGLRLEDFDNAGISLPRPARSAVAWLRKYTALAAPCWDGVELAGFQLYLVKGTMYLPLSDDRATPAAFSHIPSVTDDFAVVVDCPVVALRLTIWSMLCNGRPTGFIYPQGMQDSAENYRCGSTVFMPTGPHTDHYLRSLNTPDARVLSHTVHAGHDLRTRYPANASWGQFVAQLSDALPSHQAIAYYLLELSQSEARPQLARRNVDLGDRAKIVSYVSGEDAAHLERLFASSNKETTIVWGGHIIADTESGWICKGKVISGAKLYLDQIRPQGTDGEAIVTGNVVYHAPNGERCSLPFRESLSKIRPSCGAWLQCLVLAGTGYFPYVEKSWARKLFDIAQQFKAPTPILADQLYGWVDSSRLRLPNFTVDMHNLYASRSMLSGPGIPMPAPLSPSEWAAFKSPSFCRMFVALVGNLLRTREGRRGFGIMLTNEPHVVSRLAMAFGAAVLNNPTSDIVDEHATDPLPLFTEWSDSALRGLFAKGAGHRNVVLSVDSRTAKVSRLRADWLQLSISEAIDYPALRGIFLLLPAVLRSQVLVLDGDTFYRDVADLLTPLVAEACTNHKLKSAGIDLDNYNSYRSGTAATRVLELIFDAVENQQVKPIYLPDSVKINKRAFLRTMAGTAIPAPSSAEITDRLQDARFLVSDTEDTWGIGRLAWDINASLADLTVG